eukprot:scaffold54793_cov43-Phaeocystis_antarctica.AAC.2
MAGVWGSIGSSEGLGKRKGWGQGHGPRVRVCAAAGLARRSGACLVEQPCVPVLDREHTRVTAHRGDLVIPDH